VIWIECRERMPINGQEVWYWGPCIGVWRGHYRIERRDAFCPHLFICGESPGVVDRMDAPFWMPYETGAARPSPPTEVASHD
jgi:hypothetical protein